MDDTAVGTAAAAPAAGASALVVHGEVVVYRIFDVGYEIDLDRAFALLASRGAERTRPTRGEAQAIRIANPPVMVALGTERIAIAGTEQTLELSARVFGRRLPRKIKGPGWHFRYKRRAWNAFVAMVSERSTRQGEVCNTDVANYYGSIVGKTLTLDGTTNLHYDETRPDKGHYTILLVK